MFWSSERTDGNINVTRQGSAGIDAGVDGRTALNLDGTTDTYFVSSALTLGGALSFSFYARWDAFNSWSRIFDWGNGAYNQNILVANDGTSNDFVF